MDYVRNKSQPVVSSRLTRMDSRLAFFAFEYFPGTVLVTGKTTVLRRAVTYRW